MKIAKEDLNANLCFLLKCNDDPLAASFLTCFLHCFYFLIRHTSTGVHFPSGTLHGVGNVIILKVIYFAWG